MGLGSGVTLIDKGGLTAQSRVFSLKEGSHVRQSTDGQPSVVRPYGGLYKGLPVDTFGLSTTPLKLTGWDSAMVSQLMTSDEIAGEVTTLVAGDFALDAFVVFDGPNNRTFLFEFYLNDVATGFVFGGTTTNQSGQVTTSVAILAALAKDDTLSLYAYLDSGSGNIDLAQAGLRLIAVGG